MRARTGGPLCSKKRPGPQKRAAMEVAGAQGYYREYYSQRASQRANHPRRIGGDKDIKFAEAFQT